MSLDQTQNVPGVFPSDANVRVIISGLAFCELSPQISKILFLRHPKYHDLRMDVYKRKNPADPPQPVASYEFPFESAITIFSDAADSDTDSGFFAEGELPLNRLLNLQTLHRKRLRPKMPLPVRPPTLLSIYKCRFYTEKMTEDAFTLVDAASGDVVFENKPVGYSMGGKIKCRKNGTTLIAISGREPIPLPESADGESWLYDICFSNHCAEDLNKCREIISADDTDFKFYYDVLEEPGNAGRRFKLIQNSSGKNKAPGEILTEKVGACNVVIEDPPL